MTDDTEYRLIESNEDIYTILKALLDAGDGYVSGSFLGQTLSVSRPAIHGKLDKLREQGFEFEAIRNKGYRLTKEPDVLHPDLIRYYCEQTGTTTHVLYFPVIDSTNNEAGANSHSPARAPLLSPLVARPKGAVAWVENGIALPLTTSTSPPSSNRISRRNNYSISPFGQASIFAALYKPSYPMRPLKSSGPTISTATVASLLVCSPKQKWMQTAFEASFLASGST